MKNMISTILETRLSEHLRNHRQIRRNGCWEYVGKQNRDGYGYLCGNKYGSTVYRISYTLSLGFPPKGYHIHHICENKICFNPDHLVAVTPRENLLLSDTPNSRNIKKTHCPRGHEYSKENTITRPNRNSRECRICLNLKQKEIRKLQKEGKYNPKKFYKKPKLTKAERAFFKNLEIESYDSCWKWTGYVNSYTLYGELGKKLAHRYSYERFIGKIPKGLHIDHLCRNRACVNPAHLEAVTRKENILRGESPAAVHSRKTHCHRGHPFEGSNLYIDVHGHRICRACKRINQRIYSKNRLTKG